MYSSPRLTLAFPTTRVAPLSLSATRICAAQFGVTRRPLPNLREFKQ